VQGFNIYFFPFLKNFFEGFGRARALEKPINFGSLPLAGQNSGASRPLMCAQQRERGDKHFKIRPTTTRFLSCETESFFLPHSIGTLEESIDYRPCNF